MRETAAAHTKIARLVLAGDADGAREAMTVHLDAYHDYLADEELLDAPIIPDASRWPMD